MKHKSEKVRSASEEMLNEFSRAKYVDLFELHMEDYDCDPQNENVYEDFT